MRCAWLCVGRRYTSVWRACVYRIFTNCVYTITRLGIFFYFVFFLPLYFCRTKLPAKICHKNRQKTTQNHIRTPKKTPTFAAAKCTVSHFQFTRLHSFFFSWCGHWNTEKIFRRQNFLRFFFRLVYSEGMQLKSGGKLVLT